MNLSTGPFEKKFAILTLVYFQILSKCFPFMAIERKSLIFLIVGAVLTVLLVVLYLSFDIADDAQESRSSALTGGALAPTTKNQGDDVRISNVTGDDPTIVDVVKNVSKHVALPDGNVTVATITNIENLRAIDPVFYERAQIGDKLLLYEDRAILYNPTIDRVLDISHTISKANL